MASARQISGQPLSQISKGLSQNVSGGSDEVSSVWHGTPGRAKSTIFPTPVALRHRESERQGPRKPRAYRAAYRAQARNLRHGAAITLERRKRSETCASILGKHGQR
jgi:hypothetical protein